MFDDHPSSKQASLDYTNIDFTCGHIESFSKGLTHDFGQRLDISYSLVFGEK